MRACDMLIRHAKRDSFDLTRRKITEAGGMLISWI